MYTDIYYALHAEFTHFVSSGVLGLLVYSSTLTIFSYFYKKRYPLLPKISSLTPEDRYIYLFSFSSGAFASLALHIYIDFIVDHFNWIVLRH